MSDFDPMTMKLDFGKVAGIVIVPHAHGWEWSIKVPGKWVGTGLCKSLDEAIERVKQMTTEQRRQENETLGQG